jgi:hypothetical protein
MISPSSRAIDFFLHFFPPMLLSSILTATNAQLGMQHGQPKPMTIDTLLHFFGILLSFSLAPNKNGDRRYFWGDGQDRLFPSPRLGRFMPRDVFEEYLRNFRLSIYTVADVAADLWRPIRFAIESFNEHRPTVFKPGTYICGDESMSEWRGRAWHVGDTVIGLPHVTKIARKPKGVGTEIRSLADGETRIILGLEIQEGKEAMATKPYSQQYGSGTSSLLRLTQPYAGQGGVHVVVADSAFASVKTAIALLVHCGMGFIGLVKTATKYFPKAYLNAYPLTNRGDHTVLQAAVSPLLVVTHPTAHGVAPINLMAVAWNDNKRKLLIATTGSTALGPPALKHRYRAPTAADGPDVGPCIIFTKEVPRPLVVKTYFDNANAVDVHNHFRQGGIHMEQAWQTQTWWHRVFSTLLGMWATDAFLAFRHFLPSSPLSASLSTFMEQLVIELLTYSSEEEGKRTTRSASQTQSAYVQSGFGPSHPAHAVSAFVFQTAAGAATAAHTIVGGMRFSSGFRPKEQSESQKEELNELPKRVRTLQRMCVICKSRKTAFYCFECTQRSGEIWPICADQAPSTWPSCRSIHVDQCAMMNN